LDCLCGRSVMAMAELPWRGVATGAAAAAAAAAEELPMVRPPPSKLGGPGAGPALPRVRQWPRAPTAPTAPTAPPASGKSKAIESTARSPGLYPSPRGPPLPRASSAEPNESPFCGVPHRPRSWEAGGSEVPRPPSVGPCCGARRPGRRAASEGLEGRESPLSAREATMLRERPPVHVPPLTAREGRGAAGPKQSRSHSHSRRTPRDREARPEEREARPGPGPGGYPAKETGGDEWAKSRAAYPPIPRSSTSQSPPPHHAAKAEAAPGQLRPPPSPARNSGGSPRTLPSSGMRQSMEAEAELGVAQASPSSSLDIPSLASQGAQRSASSPSGPSAGLEAMLAEMEREREMWDAKRLNLLSVTSPSRPGTASASTAPCPTSRPSSALAASQSWGTSAPSPQHPVEALGTPATGLPSAEDALAGESSEEGVADSAPGSRTASPLEQAVVETEECAEGSAGEDEDGDGRIAAALRAVGVVPSPTAMASLVRHSDAAPANSRWISSSRQWAAQQLRRKKERCGLRSGATTPAGSAAGNTPCGSSCASPVPLSRPATAGCRLAGTERSESPAP